MPRSLCDVVPSHIYRVDVSVNYEPYPDSIVQECYNHSVESD